MNKSQFSKLAMGHSVSTALETFTATSVPAAIAAKHAALKTKLDAIHAARAAQGEPTTGKTNGRNRVFDDMAVAVRPVAAAVASYATANHLDDLRAKMGGPASAVFRMRRAEQIRFAQQVHDAAQGELAQLGDYGVTAAGLTDLQTKIGAANAQMSASRDAIVVRKVATGELAGALDGFDALLRGELDPLVESLRDSHPTEHATYRAARVTINPTHSAEQPATPAAALAQVTPMTPAPAAPKEVAA